MGKKKAASEVNQQKVMKAFYPQLSNFKLFFPSQKKFVNAT
jgi:hypothetical protein